MFLTLQLKKHLLIISLYDIHPVDDNYPKNCNYLRYDNIRNSVTNGQPLIIQLCTY